MPTSLIPLKRSSAAVSGIGCATKGLAGCIFRVFVFPNLKRCWFGLLLAAAVAAIGAGCSGINASRSFSPLDFLLPGLLHIQNSPQVSPPLQETNSVAILASISENSLAH